MTTKKRAAEAEPAEKQRVTVRGVTVELSADVLDDIDVVEWMGEVQDGNIFVFPKLLKRLFGEDYIEVKRKLATEAGVTKATEMSKFFEEVVIALNALEAKNS